MHQCLVFSPPTPLSVQATVLSSHRQFVCRVDLLDISKGHKGDPLAIYMFSDSMEVRSEEGREGGKEEVEGVREYMYLEGDIQS